MTSSIARAGALAAGMVAPVGFDPSLMPRTAAQQGLVTGASASASLGAVALGQVLTTVVARRIGSSMGADPQARTVRTAADVCVLGTGLAAQRLLAQRPQEPLRRAIGRTAGYELALGSGAALVTSAMGALVARGDRRTRRVVPGLLTVGAAALAAPVLRQACPDTIRRRAPAGSQPAVRRRRCRGDPDRHVRRAGRREGGRDRLGSCPARARAAVGVDWSGRRRWDHRRRRGPGPRSGLREDRVRGRAGRAGARRGAERPLRERRQRQRRFLRFAQSGGPPARAHPDPGAAHRAGHGPHRRRGADPRLRGAGQRPDDRATGGAGPAGGRPPRRPGPIGAAPRLTHRHRVRQLRRGRGRRVPRARRRRHRDHAVLPATLVPVPGPGSRRPGAEPRPLAGTARAAPGGATRAATPGAHVRGEPRGAHQPGRRAPPGHRRIGRPRHRARPLDRVPVRQRLAHRGARPGRQRAHPHPGRRVRQLRAVPGAGRRAARRAALRDDHPRRGRGAQVRTPPGGPGPRLVAGTTTAGRSPGDHALVAVHHLPAGVRRHAQRLQRHPRHLRRPRPRLPSRPAGLRQRRLRPPCHTGPDGPAAPGSAVLREGTVRLHRRDEAGRDGPGGCTQAS